MDFSNIYLIVYIILWAITLLVHLKKRKTFDAGACIMFTLLLYSISSYFLYNLDRAGYNFLPMKILPFLYLYIVNMIVLKPILNFNVTKITSIERPSKFIFNGLLWLFIISSMIRLVIELPNLTEGIQRILIDSAAGQDIYNEMRDTYDSKGDGVITSVFAIISNILADTGILLMFYYLTLPNRKKIVTILLFLAFFSTVLSFIAESQRGPVMTRALTLLIGYFALKKFIDKKTERVIRSVLIGIGVLLTIPMAIITISRFSYRDGGVAGSLIEYSGQANLLFNNYAFDNNGLRYGDRTIPLFKRMLGFENVPKNFVERRMKYPFLKINDEYFIGFIGDFCLDFGPIIAFLIFVFLSIFIGSRTKIRNGTIKFHQLYLLFFLMCICMQGSMKLFAYADMGNLVIIGSAFIYWAFKYSNNLKKL